MAPLVLGGALAPGRPIGARAAHLVLAGARDHEDRHGRFVVGRARAVSRRGGAEAARSVARAAARSRGEERARAGRLAERRGAGGRDALRDDAGALALVNAA